MAQRGSPDTPRYAIRQQAGSGQGAMRKSSAVDIEKICPGGLLIIASRCALQSMRYTMRAIVITAQ